MLSKRLQAVVAEITHVETLADIGTDHGFLVIEAINRGLANKVIATDVSAPCLTKARRNIEDAGIYDNVDYRLGFGLDVIANGEAQSIVIAGMGGQLLTRILGDGKGADTYILSPHSNVRMVREYLANNGFDIIKDYTVFSNNKYYVIIKAIRGRCELTRLQKAFGKTNLDCPTDDFRAYLDNMEKRYKDLAKRAKGDALNDVTERLEDIKLIRQEL